MKKKQSIQTPPDQNSSPEVFVRFLYMRERRIAKLFSGVRFGFHCTEVSVRKCLYNVA